MASTWSIPWGKRRFGFVFLPDGWFFFGFFTIGPDMDAYWAAGSLAEERAALKPRIWLK